MRYLFLFVLALLSPFSTLADSKRFDVKPICLLSNDGIWIQSIIDTNYEFDPGDAKLLGYSSKKERIFWYIDCKLKTKECEGFRVGLSKVDDGKPLGYLDAGPVVGAKIISLTPNVITIQWGFRTFVIDLKLSRIEYRESGPKTEGRGMGLCETSLQFP